MNKNKTDITVKTYDNIVNEYIEYFKNKNYTILQYFDNSLFDSSKINGKVANANQFSIIVKKIKNENKYKKLITISVPKNANFPKFFGIFSCIIF